MLKQFVAQQTYPSGFFSPMGPNAIYHSTGDNSFTEVTGYHGPICGHTNSSYCMTSEGSNMFSIPVSADVKYLVPSAADLQWISCTASGFSLPAGAVVGGNDSYNNPLYVCRAKVGKFWYGGKSVSSGSAWVPAQNTEITVTSFDVLVVKSGSVDWVAPSIGPSGLYVVPNNAVAVDPAACSREEVLAAEWQRAQQVNLHGFAAPIFKALASLKKSVAGLTRRQAVGQVFASLGGDRLQMVCRQQSDASLACGSTNMQSATVATATTAGASASTVTTVTYGPGVQSIDILTAPQHSWVPFTVGGTLPSDAVSAGTDSAGNSVLICRGRVASNSEWCAGQVVDNAVGLVIAGGTAVAVRNVEVLTASAPLWSAVIPNDDGVVSYPWDACPVQLSGDLTQLCDGASKVGCVAQQCLDSEAAGPGVLPGYANLTTCYTTAGSTTNAMPLSSDTMWLVVDDATEMRWVAVPPLAGNAITPPAYAVAAGTNPASSPLYVCRAHPDVDSEGWLAGSLSASTGRAWLPLEGTATPLSVSNVEVLTLSGGATASWAPASSDAKGRFLFPPQAVPVNGTSLAGILDASALTDVFFVLDRLLLWPFFANLPSLIGKVSKGYHAYIYLLNALHRGCTTPDLSGGATSAAPPGEGDLFHHPIFLKKTAKIIETLLTSLGGVAPGEVVSTLTAESRKVLSNSCWVTMPSPSTFDNPPPPEGALLGAPQTYIVSCVASGAAQTFGSVATSPSYYPGCSPVTSPLNFSYAPVGGSTVMTGMNEAQFGGVLFFVPPCENAVEWVGMEAGAAVPKLAIVGGSSGGSSMCFARATFNGQLLVGALDGTTGQSYLPSGTTVISAVRFEVLCWAEAALPDLAAALWKDELPYLSAPWWRDAGGDGPMSVMPSNVVPLPSQATAEEASQVSQAKGISIYNDLQSKGLYTSQEQVETWNSYSTVVARGCVPWPRQRDTIQDVWVPGGYSGKLAFTWGAGEPVRSYQSCYTTTQVLVVNKLTDVRWVKYAQGSPIPKGAVLGGVVPPGLPLYVALWMGTNAFCPGWVDGFGWGAFPNELAYDNLRMGYPNNFWVLVWSAGCNPTVQKLQAAKPALADKYTGLCKFFGPRVLRQIRIKLSPQMRFGLFTQAAKNHSKLLTALQTDGFLSKMVNTKYAQSLANTPAAPVSVMGGYLNMDPNQTVCTSAPSGAMNNFHTSLALAEWPEASGDFYFYRNQYSASSFQRVCVASCMYVASPSSSSVEPDPAWEFADRFAVTSMITAFDSLWAGTTTGQILRRIQRDSSPPKWVCVSSYAGSINGFALEPNGRIMYAVTGGGVIAKCDGCKGLNWEVDTDYQKSLSFVSICTDAHYGVVIGCANGTVLRSPSSSIRRSRSRQNSWESDLLSVEYQWKSVPVPYTWTICSTSNFDRLSKRAVVGSSSGPNGPMYVARRFRNGLSSTAAPNSTEGLEASSVMQAISHWSGPTPGAIGIRSANGSYAAMFVTNTMKYCEQGNAFPCELLVMDKPNWVPYDTAAGLPPNAVDAGVNYDGTMLYVARVPGQPESGYCDCKGVCYSFNAGDPSTVTSGFEVLVCEPSVRDIEDAVPLVGPPQPNFPAGYTPMELTVQATVAVCCRFGTTSDQVVAGTLDGHLTTLTPPASARLLESNAAAQNLIASGYGTFTAATAFKGSVYFYATQGPSGPAIYCYNGTSVSTSAASLPATVNCFLVANESLYAGCSNGTVLVFEPAKTAWAALAPQSALSAGVSSMASVMCASVNPKATGTTTTSGTTASGTSQTAADSAQPVTVTEHVYLASGSSVYVVAGAALDSIGSPSGGSGAVVLLLAFRGALFAACNNSNLYRYSGADSTWTTVANFGNNLPTCAAVCHGALLFGSNTSDAYIYRGPDDFEKCGMQAPATCLTYANGITYIGQTAGAPLWVPKSRMSSVSSSVVAIPVGGSSSNVVSRSHFRQTQLHNHEWYTGPIPGYCNGGFSEAYSGYGGVQYSQSSDFDVLCLPANSNSSQMQWVSNSDGHPSNAIVGGIDSDNETLYVARGNYNGQLLGGKAKNNTCYVTVGGTEYNVSDFDYLTTPSTAGFGHMFRTQSSFIARAQTWSSNYSPGYAGLFSYNGDAGCLRCFYPDDLSPFFEAQASLSKSSAWSSFKGNHSTGWSQLQKTHSTVSSDITTYKKAKTYGWELKGDGRISANPVVHPLDAGWPNFEYLSIPPGTRTAWFTCYTGAPLPGSRAYGGPPVALVCGGESKSGMRLYVARCRLEGSGEVIGGYVDGHSNCRCVTPSFKECPQTVLPTTFEVLVVYLSVSQLCSVQNGPTGATPAMLGPQWCSTITRTFADDIQAKFSSMSSAQKKALYVAFASDTEWHTGFTMFNFKNWWNWVDPLCSFIGENMTSYDDAVDNAKKNGIPDGLAPISVFFPDLEKKMDERWAGLPPAFTAAQGAFPDTRYLIPVGTSPESYVGRAIFPSGTLESKALSDSSYRGPIPGYANASDGIRVPFSTSHTLTDFELLMVPDSSYVAWVSASAGQPIPANAILAGVDVDGHSLYPARGKEGSTLYGGKVTAFNGSLGNGYVASSSTEYTISSFDVLVWTAKAQSCKERTLWESAGNTPRAAVSSADSAVSLLFSYLGYAFAGMTDGTILQRTIPGWRVAASGLTGNVIAAHAIGEDCLLSLSSGDVLLLRGGEVMSVCSGLSPGSYFTAFTKFNGTTSGSTSSSTASFVGLTADGHVFSMDIPSAEQAQAAIMKNAPTVAGKPPAIFDGNHVTSILSHAGVGALRVTAALATSLPVTYRLCGVSRLPPSSLTAGSGPVVACAKIVPAGILVALGQLNQSSVFLVKRGADNSIAAPASWTTIIPSVAGVVSFVGETQDGYAVGTTAGAFLNVSVSASGDVTWCSPLRCLPASPSAHCAVGTLQIVGLVENVLTSLMCLGSTGDSMTSVVRWVGPCFSASVVAILPIPGNMVYVFLVDGRMYRSPALSSAPDVLANASHWSYDSSYSGQITVNDVVAAPMVSSKYDSATGLPLSYPTIFIANSNGCLSAPTADASSTDWPKWAWVNGYDDSTWGGSIEKNNTYFGPFSNCSINSIAFAKDDSSDTSFNLYAAAQASRTDASFGEKFKRDVVGYAPKVLWDDCTRGSAVATTFYRCFNLSYDINTGSVTKLSVLTDKTPAVVSVLADYRYALLYVVSAAGGLFKVTSGDYVAPQFAPASGMPSRLVTGNGGSGTFAALASTGQSSDAGISYSGSTQLIAKPPSTETSSNAIAAGGWKCVGSSLKGAPTAQCMFNNELYTATFELPSASNTDYGNGYIWRLGAGDTTPVLDRTISGAVTALVVWQGQLFGAAGTYGKGNDGDTHFPDVKYLESGSIIVRSTSGWEADDISGWGSAGTSMAVWSDSLGSNLIVPLASGTIEYRSASGGWQVFSWKPSSGEFGTCICQFGNFLYMGSSHGRLYTNSSSLSLSFPEKYIASFPNVMILSLVVHNDVLVVSPASGGLWYLSGKGVWYPIAKKGATVQSAASVQDSTTSSNQLMLASMPPVGGGKSESSMSHRIWNDQMNFWGKLGTRVATIIAINICTMGIAGLAGLGTAAEIKATAEVAEVSEDLVSDDLASDWKGASEEDKVGRRNSEPLRKRGDPLSTRSDMSRRAFTDDDADRWKKGNLKKKFDDAAEQRWRIRKQSRAILSEMSDANVTMEDLDNADDHTLRRKFLKVQEDKTARALEDARREYPFKLDNFTKADEAFEDANHAADDLLQQIDETQKKLDSVNDVLDAYKGDDREELTRAIKKKLVNYADQYSSWFKSRAAYYAASDDVTSAEMDALREAEVEAPKKSFEELIGKMKSELRMNLPDIDQRYVDEVFKDLDLDARDERFYNEIKTEQNADFHRRPRIRYDCKTTADEWLRSNKLRDALGDDTGRIGDKSGLEKKLEGVQDKYKRLLARKGGGDGRLGLRLKQRRVIEMKGLPDNSLIRGVLADGFENGDAKVFAEMNSMFDLASDSDVKAAVPDSIGGDRAEIIQCCNDELSTKEAKRVISKLKDCKVPLERNGVKVAVKLEEHPRLKSRMLDHYFSMTKDSKLREIFSVGERYRVLAEDAVEDDRRVMSRMRTLGTMDDEQVEEAFKTLKKKGQIVEASWFDRVAGLKSILSSEVYQYFSEYVPEFEYDAFEDAEGLSGRSEQNPLFKWVYDSEDAANAAKEEYDATVAEALDISAEEADEYPDARRRLKSALIRQTADGKFTVYGDAAEVFEHDGVNGLRRRLLPIAENFRKDESFVSEVLGEVSRLDDGAMEKIYAYGEQEGIENPVASFRDDVELQLDGLQREYDRAAAELEKARTFRSVEEDGLRMNLEETKKQTRLLRDVQKDRWIEHRRIPYHTIPEPAAEPALVERAQIERAQTRFPRWVNRSLRTLLGIGVGASLGAQAWNIYRCVQTSVAVYKSSQAESDSDATSISMAQSQNTGSVFYSSQQILSSSSAGTVSSMSLRSGTGASPWMWHGASDGKTMKQVPAAIAVLGGAMQVSVVRDPLQELLSNAEGLAADYSAARAAVFAECQQLYSSGKLSLAGTKALLAARNKAIDNVASKTTAASISTGGTTTGTGTGSASTA